jgi:uncharacterized protein (DUF2345 family)
MKKCTVVLALMMLVNIAIQAGAELKITGAEVKVTGGEIKIGNNGEIKVLAAISN